MKKRFPNRVQSCLLLLLGIALMMPACTWDNSEPFSKGGYPDDVANIMVLRCAEAGCHDNSSFEAEGRLSLATWEAMFQGSRTGAAVIPYRVDQSYLQFFINTDTSQGITQTPTMPLNRAALRTDEIQLIHDWIEAGAPDENGRIMWSDNPNRAKIYVANQGCDQVSVVDRKTKLVMRYVDIGVVDGFVESPHMIKVSPDGEFWYVVFLAANNYIEKYDADTDQFVGRIDIGPGGWNTFAMSSDGKYIWAVDYNNGTVALCDTDLMMRLQSFSIGGSPHGSDLNKEFDALYVTQQEGDELVKLRFTDPENPFGIESIDLGQGRPKAIPGRAFGPARSQIRARRK